MQVKLPAQRMVNIISGLQMWQQVFDRQRQKLFPQMFAVPGRNRNHDPVDCRMDADSSDIQFL